MIFSQDNRRRDAKTPPSYSLFLSFYILHEGLRMFPLFTRNLLSGDIVLFGPAGIIDHSRIQDLQARHGDNPAIKADHNFDLLGSTVSTMEVFLHHICLQSPTSDYVDILADILRPHIPDSLPVIGCLFSSDLNTNPLHIWTTFPLSVGSEPPPLFSVIILSPLNGQQFRYFCSATVTKSGRCQEEEAELHVRAVFARLLTSFAKRDRTVDGIEVEKVIRKIGNPLRSSIYVGAVHAKWQYALKSFAIKGHPCIICARPPKSTGRTSNWDCSSDSGWTISQLRESDVPHVRDRLTAFPRSYEHILARLPYSVCVRRASDDKLVAWNALDWDGALGMLFVEPECRGLGLAKMCKAAILRKLEQMYGTDEQGREGVYPWARWEFNGISPDNAASLGLTKSLDGWNESFHCNWTYFALPDVYPSVVDKPSNL
ncbi:hypothetical protein K474DRAFT_34882 [Panus rudis PR-1116 ss-1]|nr:hypothetical protein K474DRAFT_34882 [Panus rudis PR-1116 ss-1]